MTNTIYSLGFFDGVHLGHRALLNICRTLAGSAGCDAGAVTFAAHPEALVLGKAPVLINTIADRERLLLRYVDSVVTLPFDRQMQDTPWEDFLMLLRRDYGAAGFVCGNDFRFGARGAGTPALLADYCRREGLPCAVVSERVVDGTRVSSTHIRTLLESGDMEAAAAFLGHPHMLTGTVVPGKQLGRTLGIPTANLAFPDGLAVPRFGVYACLAHTGDGTYPAVTNIGTRPTVQGHGITVEPWLLDFHGNLYGTELTLEFHTFVRPEQKFESLADLQAEIQRNAEQTRQYFAQSGLPYKKPCQNREDRI